MTRTLRRPARTVSVVLGVALAVVGISGPAGAGPVSSPYTCSSPSLNGQALKLDLNLDTTAPATLYVGRSVTPTLVIKAKIPGSIVALASLFGVKSASATGTYTIGINGTATKLALTFPRTDIPQSSTDFPVTLHLPMPKLTATAPGKVVFTPGPVALTLTGYNRTAETATSGDSVGSVDAACTSDTPKQKIDTVSYAKAPTTTTDVASYAKATKKLAAHVTVTSKTGAVPAGSVTLVLSRNGAQVRTATLTLVNGAASHTFSGIGRAGSYELVTRYGGSHTLRGSSTSKSFTIH
ncbi:MAG: Adhesin-like protein [Marmoricola sp.]|nr:Adhesin-like protein [Marmoricola sp.]